MSFMYFQYSSPRTELPDFDFWCSAEHASDWELIGEPPPPKPHSTPHNLAGGMDQTTRTSLDLTDLALAATGAALLASALLW